MISHVSECISKVCVIGYGGLLTWIFRKLGVPLEGQNFPMSPNNMIGAKCLSNLHLKLNENGTLENVTEQINVQSDNKVETNKVEEEMEEQEKEGSEEEEQELVPSAIEKAEGCSDREHVEVTSKGEVVKEAVEKEKEDIGVSKEVVSMPIMKQSGSTPRKSRRLAAKGKRPIVVLDDDSTSYKTAEPSNPPSPKPTTPSSHHFPSPTPSPIPTSPPPVHTSQNQGFDQTTVPTAPLYSILLKLDELQSRFFAFQDEVRVSLASLTDQLTQMEARLGAKLDTFEVETEYIDEEAPTS